MSKIFYNNNQYAGAVTPQPEMCPIGKIDMYAGSNAPTGWLLCRGQAVSRTAYADLFAVIGTTYGEGDGSTTFNVPDLRDRVPVGAGNDYLLNDSGGTDWETFENSQIAHGHEFTQPTVSGGGHDHVVKSNWGQTYGGTANWKFNLLSGGTAPSSDNLIYIDSNTGAHSHTVSGGAVANLYGASNTRTQHDNRMPYRGINFIIYCG